jgi:ribosomal protein S18 acetylase RimI-like enzyme
VETRLYQAADAPSLRAIARASFRGTRFDADPGFAPGRAADLYDVWLERSCAGWARAVLVGLVDRAPAGFVTCHDDGEGAWRIGLIGVAGSARGRGVGRALVAAALDSCARSGGQTMSVTTQGANVPAQRLYQRAGFLTSSVHVWYHRWFEATHA